MLKYKFILWICFNSLFLLLVTDVEAGLLSGLTKLSNKAHLPDSHLSSSLHLMDELKKYSEGSAVEATFSYSQNKWLVKTLDGQTKDLDQFLAEHPNSDHSLTLVIDEKNLPSTFGSLEALPKNTDIKIQSRNGKSFSLQIERDDVVLIDRNISINLNDIASLKEGIWLLQRPLITPNIRLFNLTAKPSKSATQSSYGSKLTIEDVNVDDLLKTMSSIRMQTVVISAPLQQGVVIIGKQKIALEELEKVAKARDINLLLIGADKPKGVLNDLAKQWQRKKDSGELLSYKVGDFYNLFSPKGLTKPVSISLSPTGQLQRSLYYEKANPSTYLEIQGTNKMSMLPVELAIKFATFYHPTEVRSKELEDRIFPSIPSDVHLLLIFSFIIGITFFSISWFLYLKIWKSPTKASAKNRFTFSIFYFLHRIVFLMFYLPIIGFISPVYLLLNWVVRIFTYLVRL